MKLSKLGWLLQALAPGKTNKRGRKARKSATVNNNSERGWRKAGIHEPQGEHGKLEQAWREGKKRAAHGKLVVWSKGAHFSNFDEKMRSKFEVFSSKHFYSIF